MLFSQISACLKSAQMRHRVTVYNGACILLVQISTRTRGQIPTDRRTQTDRQTSPNEGSRDHSSHVLAQLREHRKLVRVV